MKRFILPAVVAAMTFGSMLPAMASEFERVPPISDALVKKECGACHMAFQPAFLPAASWSALMGDLSNHFGEDASLPEADAKAIEAYYVAHAGRGSSTTGAPVLRITELGWWQRKHRPGEVSQARFDKAGSKAACVACHVGADRGLYEDD